MGLVGACGAGKSTLAAYLMDIGYSVRQIAQEHSYVQAMWQIISNPDVLIYLYVDFEHTIIRKNLNWVESDYKKQISRLEHAREHADIIIDTNKLSIEGVAEEAIRFLSTYENRTQMDLI